MDDNTKPKPPAQRTKRGKKLDLNKETVQELDDAQLDNVAGGILGTKGGHCQDKTYQPACPSGNLNCIAPTHLLCP